MNIIPAFLRKKIQHRPNLLKIADNIGWLFFDKILRMGVGLLVGVWIARYLGPEKFGLLNFAIAFTGFFAAIATIGLQDVVVREMVQNPKCARETLGTAALLQLAGGVVSFILIVATITYLRPNDPLTHTIVTILGAINLFKASEIAVYWFESQVQSKYTVWVQNGVFLMFAAIRISLIFQSASLIAFSVAMLAEQLVVAIALMVMMGKKSLKITQLNASFNRAKSLFKDAWPLVLSPVAVSLYMNIDQIMIGQMIDDEAVGIYSAAVRISEVWYFIPMVIAASVFPAILEAKNRSDNEYNWRLLNLYKLMVGISLVVAIPMTFLAEPVVSLLYGNAYAAAGSVLAIHIWASIFVFWGIASAKWFMAENLQTLSLQRTVLGAIANVGLNFWLIPRFGEVGAAIATVISYSFVGLFADLFQKKTRGVFFMKIKSLQIFSISIRRI